MPSAKFAPLPGADNITFCVTDDAVIFRMSRDAAGRVSASGKSTVYGSTRGNRGIPGTELTAGINIYGPVS